jgi:hypothetical protein
MSVDLRTRVDTEQAPVDAGQLFRETLPARFDAHRALIAPGAAGLDLVDFCFETEGEPVTLCWREDRARIHPGRHGQARVRLTAEQLSDIANDQSTPVALMSNVLLDMPEGGLPHFLDWWLVLRAALDGRRIHAAGDVEIDAQLAETHDGQEHLVRMEGFDRYSETATGLIQDRRFLRIATIPGCGHVPYRKPGQRVSALSKPIGVVKGISDVPWHKDCSLGRHSYECCNLTVGISVNGADAESGQLRVVPGTHRALVWPAPCVQPGLHAAHEPAARAASPEGALHRLRAAARRRGGGGGQPAPPQRCAQQDPHPRVPAARLPRRRVVLSLAPASPRPA